MSHIFAFAPMEGVTDPEYRMLHARYFPGVSRYFSPFLSPTQDRVFSPRELRQVAPENNRGVTLVPQILSKNAEDSIWALSELAELGYREINLNMGCPSGTVVAKGKGAGMLRDPALLDAYLGTLFSSPAARQPGMRISVKTRVGLTGDEQWEDILRVYLQYPLSALIIHPRARTDWYRGPIREGCYDLAARQCESDFKGILCYNGDLADLESCDAIFSRWKRTDALMLGRGLVANPALLTAPRGKVPDRGTLKAFHDALCYAHVDRLGWHGALAYMKEIWFYMIHLFADTPERAKLAKAINKAQNGEAFTGAATAVFEQLELCPDKVLPGIQ